MKKFPENFVWGVACASYQCEGGWDADGKGPNIWDDFTHEKGVGHVKFDHTGDVACDSYHRFREDVALMRAHNIKAYRFSISWARVIPDGDGEVNEAGLRYYDELVDELIANGIEPWITLYHWDLPSALQKKGGWLNRDIAKAFGRYARIIGERFRGRVTHYMTLNEPQCVCSLGYGSGTHAPGLKMGAEKLAEIYFNLCLSHSEAQRALKAADSSAVVGTVSCGRQCFPDRDTPENREAAYRASFDLSGEGWDFTFNIFLDPLIFRHFDESAPAEVHRFAATLTDEDWAQMETPDFIGINIYQGVRIAEDGSVVPNYDGFPVTGCKWPVTPEVLHYGPMNIVRRYGLPVYITENGRACNDIISVDGEVHDPARIDFLTRYLRELHKAIEEGTPVLGYLQWSFLDNFEWAEGYNERFGIVFVDYPTLRRIPKDSARWYAGVIESEGAKVFE